MFDVAPVATSSCSWWAEMAPRRKLAAVAPATERDRAPDLRDAVRAALATMDWLTDSDVAIRALALRQADEIEAAVDRAEELAALRRDLAGDPGAYRRLQALEAMCDVTKVVGWLGPQLQGVLRDLGGTPAARAAMKAEKPIGGRLQELRKASKGPAADAAGQDDS